jgi:hypothetical protein
MGWDQEICVESVDQFLQRLVGIDKDFISKEVKRRMEEMGLAIVNTESLGDVDDYYGGGMNLRITLSDGRVFIHKRVHTVCSDDWGRDEYELRDEKEDTKAVHESLLDSPPEGF